MLNDAERALVSRDPMLPGLATLLDETALTDVLRQQGPFLSLKRVSVTYIRYKPKTSCVVGLTLCIADEAPYFCFARALTRSRFVSYCSWLISEGKNTGCWPETPVLLNELAAFVSSPLLDRRLCLAALYNDRKYTALLQNTRDSVTGGQSRERWHFLRYKPGRRCVIGVYRDERPFAVIRCAAEKEFFRQLRGSQVGASLAHIELLGVNETDRLIATRWIAGKSLDYFLHGDPDCLSLVTLTGKSLARIHHVPYFLPEKQTCQGALRQLWQEHGMVAALYPQLAERFSHCILRLEALSEWLNHEQVLLHGDFSADQVIVSEDRRRVNIIDWDRCVYGHPAGDPGCFIARTEMDVINGELTAAQAGAIRDALLAGYKMERKISDFDIRWYTAKALMCLVVEPFRKRDVYWPEKAELLLNRVEDICVSAVFIS
ncbi:phosphotransferase family protein [Escherichia coli]|uniref:phosphotransferase family protein n=1 Tax=Escherichia coli TaxID=562 RepID=UPI003C72F466